jgi:hypothetical protein
LAKAPVKFVPRRFDSRMRHTNYLENPKVVES